MAKLVGLSGSLRAASFNTGLLRAAAELVPEGSSLTVATPEGIPLYNADLEREAGMPEAVERLKAQIIAADALLLATPEYNNGIPGVLKNAIDWLSRPPSDMARVFAGRIRLEQVLVNLLNNAANDDRHEIEDVTPEYWESRMNVNLRHMFFCTQAVLPGMKQRGQGAILNFGSISWHIPHTQLHLYMTAKAGIEGMTRALAREIGSRNITVNCVAPGFIDTDMTKALGEGQHEALLTQIPLGRLGQPEDIAHAVAFLAGPTAAYITGTELHVNGGMYMN